MQAPWITRFRECAPLDVRRVLIGNKIDLGAAGTVSPREGQDLARQYRMPFFETSAVTGENIENGFQELVRVLRILGGSCPRTENKLLFWLNGDETDKEMQIIR
jgi:GTPase SAR1 family protein